MGRRWRGNSFGAVLLGLCGWVEPLLAQSSVAQSSIAQSSVTLAGPGSSLAGPLVGMWGKKFHDQHPEILVGYVATSSSEGMEAVSRQHGDFSISEIPVAGKSSAGSGLVRIPLAVLSMTPVYNLPGAPRLRFTGELLAQIYMGRIANWNVPAVAQLNPGVTLPDLGITVLQRPDGTGSRYIFDEFLKKTSPEFRKWSGEKHSAPATKIVAPRSKGLAEKLAATPGAIGFVDYQVAVQMGLRSGSVRNATGRYVEASAASIAAAAAAMQELVNVDAPGPLVNAAGENSYPLSGFAWFYLPVRPAAERKEALSEFLRWCVGEGQDWISGSSYDRLPKPVADEARMRLSKLFPSRP